MVSCEISHGLGVFERKYAPQSNSLIDIRKKRFREDVKEYIESSIRSIGKNLSSQKLDSIVDKISSAEISQIEKRQGDITKELFLTEMIKNNVLSYLQKRMTNARDGWRLYYPKHTPLFRMSSHANEFKIANM